jgi:hypothetical protein
MQGREYREYAYILLDPSEDRLLAAPLLKAPSDSCCSQAVTIVTDAGARVKGNFKLLQIHLTTMEAIE